MSKQFRVCFLLLLFFLNILIGFSHGVTTALAAVNLFGTVEFRAPKDKIPAWISVLDKQKISQFFINKDKWRGSFDTFKAQYDALGAEGKIMEQLSMVNLYWNQYPYREDIANVYKTEDYWASIDEMAKNSGDCEDYAIAKFYTLKALGFPTDNLRIVVVHEMIRNIAHAVLAVYIEDNVYILDNLSNRIFSHTILTNYDPRFSVNEEWRWVHMRPKEK